jgi:hypothetical protein
MHSRAQAGLVTRRGILMDYALLNGLIEGGSSLSEDQFGACFIAFGQGFTQFAECPAEPGSVGTIADAACLGLACALQGRKMICHLWFVTFVSTGVVPVTVE